MTTQPTTTNLAQWLLERIAEDEAVARGLRDQYPHDTGPTYLSGNADLIEVTTGYARVLAECEAKRRIVEQYAWQLANYPDDEEYRRDTDSLGFAVRALAAIYADHEGFRAEWRA